MHTHQAYDAVTAALIRVYKTPEQIENERRLFRFRARRDARSVMQNYRSKAQFISSVESLLFALAHQAAYQPDMTLEDAISQLKRAMRHSRGNAWISFRSRLVQARYFKRYGFPVI